MESKTHVSTMVGKEKQLGHIQLALETPKLREEPEISRDEKVLSSCIMGVLAPYQYWKLTAYLMP
jgi:hypothetical protein